MPTPRQDQDEMLVEVASLFHLIGGMAPRHLSLIGGLLPPLLVPAPVPHHRGSGDIDLTISVAITKGETAEYYRSLERQRAPYFEPSESAFRWRKRDDAPGLPLLVDFLGPEVEAIQIEDGTLRPEDEAAAENLGPVLRPWPLRSAGVVDADSVPKLIKGVPLVYDPGNLANVKIRHAGPVGFLASKADAFGSRSEDKDGYDVAWWCIHADPDPAKVAALVTERPAFREEYFQECVAMLTSAFETPQHVGPTGFAREEHPGLDLGEESIAEARNLAYLAVSGVLNELKAGLWDRPAPAASA